MTMLSMDLRQIEYFVRVAEHGSFSRAAGVLRIAQPALSRQVRALEIELRQRLFDRNGRGVTLTPAGRRLFDHGLGILQQVERARLDIEDHRGAPVGRLALGLPPSISRTLTAPLVHAFRDRFPKAHIAVVEGLSVYMLEWLAQGRIDSAVVYQVAPSAAVELQPLAEETLHLVTRRRGRARLLGPGVGLTELARHELVIPGRPHSFRMMIETALAGAGLKPRIALEIESVPAILDLVAREDGAPLAAVLAFNALRDSPHEHALLARPVRDTRRPLRMKLWLATSSQRPRGPLLDQGLALLREKVAALWPTSN